jgi:uncharacterized protein
VFREIKLEERKLDNASAVEMIENGSYGLLSTMGADGYPYGVPLNYIYLDSAIYFHCALEGHKIDNIKHNEKVSFCVVAKSQVLSNEFDTDYKSVITFGKAEEVNDQQEREAIFLAILNKYSAKYMSAGKNYMKKYWKETKVIKIKIEHISGKAHE